jgi:hypothetical protein
MIDMSGRASQHPPPEAVRSSHISMRMYGRDPEVQAYSAHGHTYRHKYYGRIYKACAAANSSTYGESTGAALSCREEFEPYARWTTTNSMISAPPRLIRVNEKHHDARRP